MSVMLNTFRPRQVNPEHYDQKMKFWKAMIEDYCDYKGSSRVSIQELKKVFVRNGTVPYCLQDVFDEMQLEGNLVSKDEFMQLPKSLTSWAIDSLLVKPLSWGFGKIKEKIVSNTQDEQTQFVVKSAAINHSKLLLEHVRTHFDTIKVISMDELMKGAVDIDGVSADGLLLALHQLSTVDKRVYIEEHNTTDPNHHHKLLLKFSEPHQVVQPITEMERSIYNLEQTEKFLLETIDKKEAQLNEVLKQVKDCLKDGKKQIAKTYLRKKHLMEADLLKSFNVLDNVQTMLQRVHASKSDKEIMSTYKMGSDAIKAAFAESGINLDNVHDIIEDMQEIYADQEECQAAISEPLRGVHDIDDSALEKELMDMIADDNKNQNTNNAGGSPKTDAKKTDDMDLLDRELEMRLKRLRSDFTALDEPKPTTTRAGMKQQISKH